MPAASTPTKGHEPVVISAAGKIKPWMEAASITPAQNPSTVSFHLWGNCLKKKPIIEPSTVARQSPMALYITF